jgi:hypothetical protein
MKSYLVRLYNDTEYFDIWSTIRDIKPYTIKLEIISVVVPIFLIQITEEKHLEYISNLPMVETIELDETCILT